MRTPDQAWQVPSVGGCLPSEITQGQNTVQLQLRMSSPLMAQGVAAAGAARDIRLETVGAAILTVMWSLR